MEESSHQWMKEPHEGGQPRADLSTSSKRYPFTKVLELSEAKTGWIDESSEKVDLTVPTLKEHAIAGGR